MAEDPKPLLVLIDAPEDGVCEEMGWVEARVSEAEARDHLAACCCDVDGNSPFRPKGEARKVILAPNYELDDATIDFEEMRWFKLDALADEMAALHPEVLAAREAEAREFWEIEVGAE